MRSDRPFFVSSKDMTTATRTTFKRRIRVLQHQRELAQKEYERFFGQHQ